MELFKSRTRVAYTNAVGDKVYPVIVDIKKGIKSTEDIQFVSSDVNTGILSVAFISGNDNFNVSGADVVCSVMRPDASTLELPCEVVRENIVEVPLGINGTSQDGVYSFDFKVLKGGNKVVGTPIMNYSVSLSISNDMVVEEDDRLPVLTMLMTQLTELKGEARESINQANTATVASREATANAIEATNNANAVSERVSQESNEVISRVDNKVAEVETRFNALTTSQQQDAEVIDARVDFKGIAFNSLKERIDYTDKLLRDSTVSTITTESDFTTVEATSNGYFEDVKLEGRTLVNLCTHLYDQKHNSVIDKGSALNYTKHPHYTQCDFKLLQNLKQNTTYTVVLNVTNFVEGMSLQVNFYKYDEWIVCSNTEYVRNKGVHTVLLTTNENIADHIRIGKMNDEVENLDEYTTLSKDIIILEGDHTQNPPAYFEGLKSVGQSATTSEDGADEIVVSSVNKLGYRHNIAIAGTSPYGIASNGVSYILEDIEIGNLVVNNFKNSERMIVATYDSLEFGAPAIERFDLPKTIGKQVVKISQKAKFALLYLSPAYNETTKGYIYQEQDKKRLLYYNEEAQAWEKPILREWDSIEKHANGKYYYHQRSGEVVLNGSEGWTISTPLEKTNTIFAYTNVPKNILNQYLLCDRFAYEKALDGYDMEGVRINNGVQIRINKSKLSTPDVEGFKQWLQTNNVTVVYQLAQEKVYECTNIDLITYANETNYIIECGAIVPKTTLKVMSNISNVVRTLQEKVSLLENKFIEGLKQVLAGDMYSLAELLYPEDFEEVETENNIMLLPLE